ncbi:MAG TPA: phosphonate ABC transporter, permease protein PhnE [Anaerolineales bacterium]|nr:phosphonate ABC transporter, permease protein PhnE [Anaerolineales bacterium]
MKTSSSPQRSAGLAALLSALVPGLGQGYVRRWYRGVAILLATLVVAGMVAWYGHPVWYFAPAGIWLWNIWDAASLAGGHPRTILIPVLFGLVAAYGIGWQVVGVNFGAADLNRAIAVARPMAHPDFFALRTKTNEMWTPVFVPCPSTGKAPLSQREDNGKTASATPSCGGPTASMTVSVTGLWPNTDTDVWWETAIGDTNLLGGTNGDKMLVVRTDAKGSLTTTIQVPLNILIAQPDKTLSLQHKIHFDQTVPIGGIQISYNGGFVLQGMLETIAMALMATFLAIFLAVPISFLAARNLMSGNPITMGIYVVVRTLLNILRSVEALIFAIIFVVITGLGPFAGVLALMCHSVAALAKLYSEVIEGIDPGPIEAIRATGANWVQVVRYGVIPQIIPPFTSFTIYRWDINVRTATVIGMVGGGGIGLYLIQWIQINDFRAVSAAFIAIAVVVIILDFISAKIRERLV